MNETLVNYISYMASRALYEVNIVDGIIQLADYHPKKHEILAMFFTHLLEQVELDRNHSLESNANPANLLNFSRLAGLALEINHSSWKKIR